MAEPIITHSSDVEISISCWRRSADADPSQSTKSLAIQGASSGPWGEPWQHLSAEHCHREEMELTVQLPGLSLHLDQTTLNKLEQWSAELREMARDPDAPISSEETVTELPGILWRRVRLSAFRLQVEMAAASCGLSAAPTQQLMALLIVLTGGRVTELSIESVEIRDVFGTSTVVQRLLKALLRRSSAGDLLRRSLPLIRPLAAAQSRSYHRRGGRAPTARYLATYLVNVAHQAALEGMHLSHLLLQDAALLLQHWDPVAANPEENTLPCGYESDDEGWQHPQPPKLVDPSSLREGVDFATIRTVRRLSNATRSVPSADLSGVLLAVAVRPLVAFLEAAALILRGGARGWQ